MDRHLITVEIRVECRADERMDPYGVALYEDRLKCLYPKPVQGRRPVEHYGMIFNNLVKNIPNFQLSPFHHLLRALYAVDKALLLKFFYYERFEKFERHLLRKAALIKFKFRPHDYDASAGIIDALAQKVLPEPSLLPLQHVAQ